ncbi:probable membrane-associated kinase regulator 2 [Dendrobium catenatum]|uniref:Putative membrane-associated kinase regulator 2 n=1 Tax=Dendrobium catenatum TaxID=906689 RepID=A0A2I0VUH2_9ASPA|nr:probable membrane-associated kinase regulator 2 [Dendrobium catenatum]PKU67055.1 putative membrane-associated kinase regulator 2 [Dendrobium catenatum]
MESFSLLKYWRGGGGAAAVSTIRAAAAAISPPPETLDENSEDDGSFFDLEFPDAHNGVEDGENQDEDEKDHFSFTMTSSSDESEFQSDRKLPLSPSDDLFFKGRLIGSTESDLKPQITVSFLKPATRLRVLMLRLRKPKSHSPELISTADAPSPKQNPHLSKFFIKFKVDEVPIASLFSRESSSRNPIAGSQSSPEERSVSSKEGVQKYLSKIKPLYVRVSKRYSDKLRFSATEPWEGEEKEAEVSLKIGKKRQKPAVSSRIKVVYKHLRKSKSVPPSTLTSPASIPLQRRDDSFLEQQDGIQSAIAHCKRSLTTVSNSMVA